MVLAKNQLKHKPKKTKTNLRRFREYYGVNASVISMVWQKIHATHWFTKNRIKGDLNHLLLAFSYLQQYQTESINAKDVEKDEKTWRKWTWLYIEAIGSLVPYVVSYFALFHLYFNRYLTFYFFRVLDSS